MDGTATLDVLSLAEPFGLAHGVVEPFTVVSPAAGANFARVTGSGYWERILMVNFLFTTAVAIANRQVSIEIQDGDGNRLGFASANILQAASLATRYSFHIRATSSSVVAGLRQTVAFPDMFLQTGYQINTQIDALQAADAITQIRGLVGRFPDGPDGYLFGEVAHPHTELARHHRRARWAEAA